MVPKVTAAFTRSLPLRRAGLSRYGGTLHAGRSVPYNIDLSESLFYKQTFYKFISITYHKISLIEPHLVLQNGLGI